MWKKGHIFTEEHKRNLTKAALTREGGKGGIIVNNGYVYEYSPNHPFAWKQKYVAQHRLVMEKKLGRYLKPSEVVHHKDGDTKNNNLENLELYPTKNEHMKQHVSKGQIGFTGSNLKRDKKTGRAKKWE